MIRAYPAFATSALWLGVFWISYLAWIGIEVWIWSRDQRKVSGAPEDQGSRRVIGAAYAIGLIGAFQLGYRVPAMRIGVSPDVLVPLGVALMWAGIAFRLWAVATLGRFFRTTLQVLDDHRLVGTGPYRRLRNPSYTGAMVTVLGVGIAIGNWAGLAILLAATLYGFVHRIRVEEALLARRFGPEHEAYRKGRWALIPFLW
jgi:protein-S-isoprenylcysteine O-methyltransferase